MISSSSQMQSQSHTQSQLLSTSNYSSSNQYSLQSLSSGATLKIHDWLPKFVYSTSEGHIRFLVDTGAVQSFVVKSFCKRPNFRARLIPDKFTVANGIALIIYGSILLRLDIGGKSYKHTFLVANVKVNLLGVEFQRDHNLLLLWDPPRLASAQNTLTPLNQIYFSPECDHLHK